MFDAQAVRENAQLTGPADQGSRPPPLFPTGADANLAYPYPCLFSTPATHGVDPDGNGEGLLHGGCMRRANAGAFRAVAKSRPGTKTERFEDVVSLAATTLPLPQYLPQHFI